MAQFQVLAGDTIRASDVNKALARRYPTGHVADSGSSAAITTVEAVALTVPSTTYRANTAYEVIVEGYFTPSTTNLRIYCRVRKTNASGNTVVEFTGIPGITSASYWLPGLRRRFTVGGTAVTTALAFTMATSSGTVTMSGSAGQQRCVDVVELGDSVDYPDLPVLS